MEKQKTSLEEFLEKGEIVYLERHISRVETKLADTRTARDHYATEAQEMLDTLTILKKLRERYGRDNPPSD